MNPQALRVIWFALAISVVIYGAIVLIAVPRPDPPQPFEAAFSNPVILVLHVAGLAMFVMSFVIPGILSRRGPNPQTFIVRWAMIESAAVCGLLAAFIGQDARLFLPLGALAIAGMLLAFPTREQLITP